MWNPPQSYYDPPEPPEPCCFEGDPEDRDYNPDHDAEACLADQAEYAAERKADAEWERYWDDDWEYGLDT